MSSSSLSQQCPACLVRLIWMVIEMEGRWPYNYCFVGCGFQDLFITTRCVLVQLPSNFLPIRFVSVHVVHPYCSIGTTAAKKKLCFILSDRFDLYMTDSLSIGVHTFASCVLLPFSVNETLLPRYCELVHKFQRPTFLCGDAWGFFLF